MSPGTGVPPLDSRLLSGVKKGVILSVMPSSGSNAILPGLYPEAPTYAVEGTEELKLWALGGSLFTEYELSSVIFSRLLL